MTTDNASYRTVEVACESGAKLVLCRACHYGHYLSCEDERCQSMRLEDRHE